MSWKISTRAMGVAVSFVALLYFGTWPFAVVCLGAIATWAWRDKDYGAELEDLRTRAIGLEGRLVQIEQTAAGLEAEGKVIKADLALVKNRGLR